MSRFYTVAFVVGISFLIYQPARLHAQGDLVSWNSIQLRSKTYQGYSFTFRPIVRHNNNLSQYFNTSVEFSIAKSMNKGFRVQYLYRYWYMGENPNRVFWWFDLSHSFSAGPKLSISNRVRWHIAMDYLSEDPNFIRYLPTASMRLSDRLSLVAGWELWLQLDGVNSLRRIRPQAGFKYRFTDRLSLNFIYWHERSIGIDPYILSYILNTTLSIKL